jgi:hypothetical protein
VGNVERGLKSIDRLPIKNTQYEKKKEKKKKKETHTPGHTSRKIKSLGRANLYFNEVNGVIKSKLFCKERLHN